ncbi:MAG: YHYH protein [Cyclobacteriaceae bacterium]|nr:YHYH protein [Cyclobacteriaceae bacterium]
MKLTSLFIIVLVSLSVSCKKDEVSPATNTTLPEVFTKKYASSVTIYVEGDFIVFKTTAIPNHKSPYFGVADSRYEAYNGTNANFAINPNTIKEQNYVFKIPLNPKEASTKAATSLGPMGISINGVPLFNQFAGPNQPLTNEINSFDQYNGHPQQTGQYHYHVEPLYITSTTSKAGLIGFLLDGFPVYGPLESGKTLTSADLDTYHGHTSVTEDYPDGIYHYHITADSPYINGGKFFGTSGTVTQ